MLRLILHLGPLPPGSKYTIADLRSIEADLKRKSDLLSEVKILLAQAAERERSLINEREQAKAKVNTIYVMHVINPLK